jgi:NifU-like protein involved in Fe-S cluster formation
MAYGAKVLDHAENPRNVGTLDKSDPNVGTGLVGAPACGDVMRLQIRVNDAGVIEDAKFKTFGCLGSNTPVATPKGYRDICDLKPGDGVWAWDGVQVVKGIVKQTVKRRVDWTQLVRLQFEHGRPVFCTSDHVWWTADNRPILTQDLHEDEELLCMTESELRSINNVRQRSDFRQRASERMKRLNVVIDRSKLPQNNVGFKKSEVSKHRSSLASKAMWQDVTYVKNWEAGMMGALSTRPTQLEHKFIDMFERSGIDVRYVGNGDFWVNVSTGERLNPDFKVNGQRKLLEVYTDRMPVHMENRSTPEWMLKKKQAYASKGFDVMFIDVKELDRCLPDVQRFIHNGIPVTSITRIGSDKRQLRGLERDGDEVIVYDLLLEEGANIFFVQRAMSHNCGSAIASSSLATEWLKGKTVDQAETIKNVDIVNELDLPPVKIHCSILAEDAIKSAIADWRNKREARTCVA